MLKRFLIPFIALGLVFGFSWLMFTHTNSPFTDTHEISLKNLSIFLFFLGGFLWIFFSLLIYLGRMAITRAESERAVLRDSLRIGAWSSLFVIFLLLFQLAGIFHPLNLVFLFIFFLMIELYFRSRKEKAGPDLKD